MEPDPHSSGASDESGAAPDSGTTETAELRPVGLPFRPAGHRERVPALPVRYHVREDDDGRYLTCLEAPEVKVRLDRKFSTTAAAARKFPEGTIFLDGAAQGEPFLDLERQVYNLDHHEGCVRRFTLATCEQALVLVMRGLDLRERSWTIWANEPDLDTLLAIWVLLNAVHLGKTNPELRKEVIALVRLEGLIDSHGLEYREFSGFPDDHLEATFEKLESLRRGEVELKSDGRWAETDIVEHTVAQLAMVDHLIYPRDFFEEFRGIEELAREELSDQRIVVVCRCDGGIYETEQELKRLYGKRLGVLVLQKAERVYTLRQVDTFLPVNLEAAYRKLNVLDSAVRGGGAQNRWGGSGEIGGSPRATGTDLTPREIASACRLAYRPPALKVRLGATALAAALAAITMVVAWLAGRWQDLGTLTGLDAHHRLALGGLALGVVLLAVLSSGRRRRLYGLQLPAGTDWLRTAPIAALGAMAGGVWVVGSHDPAGLRLDLGALPALLLFPMLAEAVFRGLAHGVLVRNFSILQSRGRWFLSWPSGISAALYAVATLPVWRPELSSAHLLWPDLPTALAAAGALAFGAAAGMARERSGSLAASLALHYVGVAIVLALRTLLA